MHSKALIPCQWSTSSFSDSADTSPQDLSALGDHLHQCRGRNGRLFALRCGAEAARHFVLARVVTTVLLVGLLLAALSAF